MIRHMIPHWKLHLISFQMSPEWTSGISSPSRASAIDSTFRGWVVQRNSWYFPNSEFLLQMTTMWKGHEPYQMLLTVKGVRLKTAHVIHQVSAFSCGYVNQISEHWLFHSELWWTCSFCIVTGYDPVVHVVTSCFTYELHMLGASFASFLAYWSWSRWSLNEALSATLNKKFWEELIACRIWGFHGGDYEECSFLGCGVV
jgi:hypothetical protein